MLVSTQLPKSADCSGIDGGQRRSGTRVRWRLGRGRRRGRVVDSREPATQEPRAFVERVGLAENVVHAGPEALVPIVDGVVRSERDDGHAPPLAFALAYEARGDEAVH